MAIGEQSTPTNFILKSKHKQETSISLYQNVKWYKTIEFAKKQTYTEDNYFSHQNGKRCKTNSIR